MSEREDANIGPVNDTRGGEKIGAISKQTLV